MSEPSETSAANFIVVDWASWHCARCCWTVPPHLREEAICEAAIRAHVASHDSADGAQEEIRVLRRQLGERNREVDGLQQEIACLRASVDALVRKAKAMR